MSNYYEIVAAFLMALVIVVFFSTVLGHKGPWGAMWLIFVIIFLASWAGYLWINPFGPLVLGISIAPILIVGIIFAFVLAAVTLPAQKKSRRSEVVDETGETTVAIGLFFWIVLIILLVAIAAGYYRMSVNTHQIVH